MTVFLVMSLVACGEKVEETEGKFNPGTYEGEAQGYGGVIKVSVEVSADKIEKIEIVDHTESESISDQAIETIPANILENQSVNVDTVSGATTTSLGLIEAIKNALLKSGVDESEISQEVQKKEVDSEKIEKEADIVIIGAGGAGLSAAVEAVKLGRSVIVIEKMPQVGGNTILAGSAYNSATPEEQKKVEMSEEELEQIESYIDRETDEALVKTWQENVKADIEAYKAENATYLYDSPDLHKLQTYFGGDMVANPELVNLLGDGALAGREFLSDLGTEWVDSVNAAVGATWKRSFTPTTKYGVRGSGFVLPQHEFLLENDVEIMLSSKADKLIMDGNKCVGVSGMTDDGQEFMVKANKSVIVATGGFGANVEMRQKYNTHWANLDETIATSNHVGATGDGIVMADDIDASLVDLDWIQLIPTYGKGVWTAYIENQFYINKEGNRFVKEDGRRDELSGAILKQTDSQIFIISDGDTVVDGVVPTNQRKVDENIDNEFVFKADTIEELAEQIGVPVENLIKSVESFNKSVTTGDDEFGRSVFDQEFGKAPFYAGLTSPMVHHTMGGIEINENTQVLNAEGNVIEGLYAAGEVTGGIHGANRLGGNAIADIITFGRIAGQKASE